MLRYRYDLCRDTEAVPDGGFVNFLQSQTSQNNENFHFTGNISHYTQFNQSASYEGSDSSPLLEPTENVEHVRKEKRIFWSTEEDSGLVSSLFKNAHEFELIQKL